MFIIIIIIKYNKKNGIVKIYMKMGNDCGKKKREEEKSEMKIVLTITYIVALPFWVNHSRA